jgi:hypothetical protein
MVLEQAWRNTQVGRAEAEGDSHPFKPTERLLEMARRSIAARYSSDAEDEDDDEAPKTLTGVPGRSSALRDVGAVAQVARRLESIGFGFAAPCSV